MNSVQNARGNVDAMPSFMDTSIIRVMYKTAQEQVAKSGGAIGVHGDHGC